MRTLPLIVRSTFPSPFSHKRVVSGKKIKIFFRVLDTQQDKSLMDGQFKMTIHVAKNLRNKKTILLPFVGFTLPEIFDLKKHTGDREIFLSFDEVINFKDVKNQVIEDLFNSHGKIRISKADKPNTFLITVTCFDYQSSIEIDSTKIP